MGSQEFCLKWNNHQGNLIEVFDDLLKSEEFVDVTLACQGMTLKVHKVVLSACSSFFKELFKGNPCKHPIVFMSDVSFSDLQAIVEFMYKGEVNVSQEQLPNLLKTAEALQVKGLAEVSADKGSSDTDLSKATSPKRKRNISGSSHQKSQANNMKQKSNERRMTKFEKAMAVKEFFAAGGQITDNGFPTTTNPPFNDNMLNSNQPNAMTNEINAALKNMKTSPHSSPEPANEQDNSNSVDPNQFLLQQFSCTESENLAKLEETNASCASGQAAFPKSSFESVNAPSSNVSLQDQSQLSSSSLKSSQNQSSFVPGMNMNALGVSMTDINFPQESTPEKLWRSRGRPASWSQENLHMAMTAVLKNGWSVTAAARSFGIPQPTLHSYISKFYKRHIASMPHSQLPSSSIQQQQSSFVSAASNLNPIASNILSTVPKNTQSLDVQPDMSVNAISLDESDLLSQNSPIAENSNLIDPNESQNSCDVSTIEPKT